MWFFDSVKCAWTVVLCVRGRGKVSSVVVVVVIVLGWMVYDTVRGCTRTEGFVKGRKDRNPGWDHRATRTRKTWKVATGFATNKQGGREEKKKKKTEPTGMMISACD